MYYELRRDPERLWGVTTPTRLPEGVSFLTGSRITAQLPSPLVVEVDAIGAAPPGDFEAAGFPVFSQRLVDWFRAAGVASLQTFPARLHNPITGETWADYQAVNILGIRACAVIEKSECVCLMEGLYSFSALTIDHDKAGGAAFFRLGEQPSVILMHVDLARRLYDEHDEPRFTGLHLTGVDFT